MLNRFVFVKLRNSTDRPSVASAAKSCFAAVPVVKGFAVMEPADSASEVWDLCFRVELDSLDDVPAYIDDPAHVRFVTEVLTPAAEVKKAWNFQPNSESS